MRNVYLFLTITMIFALSILGCSQAGSPIISTDASVDISNYNSLPVGVSDILPDGTPSSGMGALGLFELRIDPSTTEAELNSLRSSALTDVLETVDITNFLHLAPCTNCVKIKSVSLDSNGNIVVSIGVKHPFPAGDPLKPITGRNRADLHVFNVEGIVISNAPSTSFPSLGEKIAGFNLLNADGYTGYLDGVIDDFYPTDASIHPYITHFDDYSAGNFSASNAMGFASVTDPPPTGNLVMAMGCDYNFQDYVFRIDPSKPVDFIYAVGCTYALSAASKSQRFSPEYRVPQHNKKAASEVAVSIVDNHLKDGDTASTAGIEIRVVDISQGVSVGIELDEMLSDSSVASIMVEIPQVMTTPLTIPGGSPISGTGHSPSEPLLYTGTITNTSSAVEGTYSGLVKVKDTYAPGQNVAPTLNGMDGIKRVDPGQIPTSGLFAIDEFATYQTFSIDVAIQNQEPICDLAVVTAIPANGWDAGTPVEFDASGSSDPDGDSLSYKWDFDGDGVFSENPDDSYTGPDDKPIHKYKTNFNGDVCVRVLDGKGGDQKCCKPVQVILHPSKNIPLRTTIPARDIAVDPTNGVLLVLYTDGQVLKYFPDKWYDQSGASLFYTTYTGFWCIDVSQASDSVAAGDYWMSDSLHYNPSGQPVGVTSIGYAGAIRDVSFFKGTIGDAGDSCLVFGMYTYTYWTVVYHFFDPDFPWFSHHMWDILVAPTGYNTFYGDWVKGVECISNNAFWVVGGSNLYASQFKLIPGSSVDTIMYDGAYVGTGSATDANTGFNNPLDLTIDSRNRIFVLDKLSDNSPKVKVFQSTGQPAASLGGFGNMTNISGEPLRIEGSDYVDPDYGNMMFVLHGSSAPSRISIFFPEEMP